MGNKKRAKNIRLNGINPLAYVGVNPYSPPGFSLYQRDPTPKDSHNFILGDLWLNTQSDPPNPPTIDDLWMLVSLTGGIATWVQFGGGDLETLTGNTGGPVSPDGAGNINVIGNVLNGVTVAGNPGTNTLTIDSTSGDPFLQSLTGDVGGPVPADANGNINLLGTANRITTTGNPGTNTITWDVGAFVATQYTTDAGVAIPAANNLNVLGSFQIHTAGAGSTITINSESLHAFAARGLVTQPNETGDSTVAQVDCATEVYDFTNDYDTTTSTYTAPVTGLYFFGGNVSVVNTNSDTFQAGGGIAFLVNGSAILFTGGAFSNLTNTADPAHNNGAASDMVVSLGNLTAGDDVTLVVTVEGGTQTVGISAPDLASDFFGYLIQRTA